MPERELRKIALRERCLALCDRVQGNCWIGNDFIAILACDPYMVVDAFGILTFHLAPRSSRPNLVLRFKRNALSF